MSQFSPSDDKLTLADAGFTDNDIYPVGRLDYDSEGLIILTNDNKLIHLLTSHVVSHSRKYLVQVDGEITDSAISNLKQGVEININGNLYHTKPCTAKIIDKPENLAERNPPVRFRANIPTSFVEITLTEGKNRQVRKMLAKVGFPVLRLIRISISNLHLGNLESGKFLKVSKKFIYERLINTQPI